MRKLTIEQAQQKLNDAGQNLLLLDFDGTMKPCKVKCLEPNCGRIFTAPRFINLTRILKSGNFHTTCCCTSSNPRNADWRWFEEKVAEKNPDIELLPRQEWKGNRGYYFCRCRVDSHEWKALGGNLLQGSGCPKCAAKASGDRGRKSNEQYAAECKALGFEVLEEYKGAYISIRHRCIECGTEFTTTPHSILTGNTGCPKCRESTSSGEQLILNYLEDNNIDFIYQCRCNINNHRHYYDFYLPQCNLFVEIDGDQHRKPIDHWGGKPAFNNQQIKDAEKEMFCHWHGYNMIRISDKLSNQKMIDTLKREIEYINS